MKMTRRARATDVTPSVSVRARALHRIAWGRTIVRRFDEFQHELVDRDLRPEHDSVARIARIAQEIRFGDHLEPGGLDLPAQGRLLDPVQSLYHAQTGPGQ